MSNSVCWVCSALLGSNDSMSIHFAAAHPNMAKLEERIQFLEREHRLCTVQDTDFRDLQDEHDDLVASVSAIGKQLREIQEVIGWNNDMALANEEVIMQDANELRAKINALTVDVDILKLAVLKGKKK